MDVLFLGDSDAPLLGAYHPARSGVDRGIGVVLAYPFGQEYMRAHRALRLLAQALTARGVHVMRVDYRGTGDSAGDLEDFGVLDWIEDLEIARQELRDVSGVRQVGLVGLRLGALLAAELAARLGGVSPLVLWDPVVSGESYLQELGYEIRRAGEGNNRSRFVAPDGALYMNGFRMTVRFQQELRSLALPARLPSGCARTLLAVSHETPDFDRLRAGWSEGSGFEYRHAPAPHDWNYVDHVGGIMLPQPVLAAITEWM